jgi:hypothetical protein
MSKLWASIMSALLITTINTIYSEYEKNNDSVLYYSSTFAPRKSA